MLCALDLYNFNLKITLSFHYVIMKNINILRKIKYQALWKKSNVEFKEFF